MQIVKKLYTRLYKVKISYILKIRQKRLKSIDLIFFNIFTIIVGYAILFLFYILSNVKFNY